MALLKEIAHTTPEAAAFALFELIAYGVEKNRKDAGDRNYVLNLYSECIRAVRGERYNTNNSDADAG